VRKGDDVTTFILPKVEKIRSLNLPDPKGLLRPVAGKLYLHLLFGITSRFIVCKRKYRGLIPGRGNTFTETENWSHPAFSSAGTGSHFQEKRNVVGVRKPTTYIRIALKIKHVELCLTFIQ
jgi:hypothetical protein